MIVKNEQVVLARCLDSVKQFADEIIIVDTGSVDKTVEIALKYTDKVYNFEWCDDFSAARNFAFSKATLDYVMWLDADDVVTYENIEKINQLKLNLVADTYMFKYATSFDALGNPTFVFERERLLRRCAASVWQGFVHEVIVPFGVIRSVDITIQHRKIGVGNPKRNVGLYRKALRRGVKFSAREQYYYSKELFYLGYYRSSERELKKFLAMSNKYLPNTLDAMLTLSKCCINLNKINEAKKWLYEAIDICPTAENVCSLALIYERENKPKLAIFWYENALNISSNAVAGAFVLPEYYHLVPLLQLTKLYYNLGDKTKALHYHEILKNKYPTNPSVTFNEQFFNNK